MGKQDPKKLVSEENSIGQLPENIAVSKDFEAITRKYNNRDIDFELYRELADAYKDPNKMKSDAYKNLIRAFAKGKFRNRGQHAREFLKALEGGSIQGKLAGEILKQWGAELPGTISKSREKEALKSLAKAKEKEISEQTGVKVKESTGKIVAAADFRSSIEKATKVERQNWQIPSPPKEVIEKLDELGVRHFQLANESNKKADELKKELAKTNPDQKMIDKIEEELKKLDEEIDKLREEIAPLEQFWVDYYKGVIAQFRAIKEFSRRAGLNFDVIEKLKVWLIKGKGGDVAKKLKGIIAKPETGKTEKSFGSILITDITFESKDDPDPDTAGIFKIKYINEEGKPEESTMINFLEIINGMEAYEEIESSEKFNEIAKKETLYTELEEGQVYEKQVLVGLDENGNKQYETDSFSVEAIEIEDGEMMIKLDRRVKKIPKGWLRYATDDALYFDRFQKDFTLGEFAKFLKQHRISRKLSADENFQAILDRMEEDKRSGIQKYMAGADEEQQTRFKRINGLEAQKITLPEEGEEKKVKFFDKKNGVKRKGKLRAVKNNSGETEYEIEYALNGGDGVWTVPEYPEKLFPPIQSAIPGGPKIEKIRLPKGSFYEMADKERIKDSDEDSEGEEDESSGEGEGDNGEKEPKKMTGKPDFYEEAQPYDVVNKVGGFTREERGLLKSIWVETRFFSVMDLWEMGKVMWEYYKRRFERRQKEKYSSIGKNLPFFAPEMQRINQSAENEQVGQFKEALDQFGVPEIQERLRKTSNRDELKATIQALTEKGQMRWDDIDVWRNINKFVSPDKAIPIPSNGDPFTKLGPGDDRTGFDFLRVAIDSLWGDGGYNDWYSKNKSSFASNAKGYYEEGSELENLTGGHQRRLSILLGKHKGGEWVDPHEYEGLILHSIENGKASIQSKIYYMVEGVAAANPDGRTILSMDRMAHINSLMLGKFPILEYMTANAPREAGDKIERHRFTIDDYKDWLNIFDEGKPSNTVPTQSVDDFLWRYVIPSDDTQNRINKALRRAEELDHDDMFAYAPPASYDQITNICRTSAGSRKFLTVEGYANVFPGFSQYMYSLAKFGNADRLMEAVRSYVRFEGVITNKFEKEKGDQYQRLADTELENPPIVSDIPPVEYIGQMNSMVKKLVEYLDDPRLTELANTIYNTKVGDIARPEEKKKQQDLNYAFDQFNPVFAEVIKRPGNRKKLLDIVNNAGLWGMPYTTDSEKDRKKASRGGASD